ncbi:DUF2892 domain-containing protein, partial [Pseudomonas aeruginosa]
MNEYLPTSTANGLPHNLQRGERLASIGAGLVLAGFGLARGGLPGACKAVAGGLLVSRGLSGHCHVKGLLNEPRDWSWPASAWPAVACPAPARRSPAAC